jgi:hypothetical protein
MAQPTPNVTLKVSSSFGLWKHEVFTGEQKLVTVFGEQIILYFLKLFPETFGKAHPSGSEFTYCR